MRLPRRRAAIGLLLASATASGCLSTGHDTARLERRVRELEDQLYVLQRNEQELQRRIDALDGGERRPVRGGDDSYDRRPNTGAARDRGDSAYDDGARSSSTAAIDRPAVRAVTESPIAAPSRASSGAKSFEEGREAFDEGRFEEAIPALKAFIDGSPGHQNRPDAMFLLGESYYGAANFPQAIVEYGKIVESYPRHAYASESLYKIALSYYELGFSENALSHLRRLQGGYPESRAAQAAEPLIERLSR